jgi:hypothetical protein
MLFVRTLVASVAGATALGVVLFAGCSDDTGTGGGGPSVDISDVIYVGGMTDEALEALLAAPLKSDPAKTAAFTWPSSGEPLPQSEPIEFCWHVGPIESAAPRAKSDRRLGAIPRDVFLPTAKKTSVVEGVATQLLESILSGVPSAHAHGTPVDGPGYFLVISNDSDPNLLRVFTNSFDYQPEQADWDRLAGIGGELTAKVIWADFETNRVLNDGGPWDGTAIKFTITPN